jgi:hypothetical protein
MDVYNRIKEARTNLFAKNYDTRITKAKTRKEIHSQTMKFIELVKANH